MRNIGRLVALFSAVGFGLLCSAQSGLAGPERFRIPGTEYEVILDGSAAAPTAPGPDLIVAIADWVAREFDLPAIARYPRIEIASSDEITRLRYGPLTGRAHAGGSSGVPSTGDTLGIYMDRAETIYLLSGWSAGTPADLSVLVHEMVHHFQNVLRLSNACAQERERLAYRAQERWLGLFGLSLEADFELDGFTLLVRTRCLH